MLQVCARYPSYDYGEPGFTMCISVLPAVSSVDETIAVLKRMMRRLGRSSQKSRLPINIPRGCRFESKFRDNGRKIDSWGAAGPLEKSRPFAVKPGGKNETKDEPSWCIPCIPTFDSESGVFLCSVCGLRQTIFVSSRTCNSANDITGGRSLGTCWRLEMNT